MICSPDKSVVVVRRFTLALLAALLMPLAAQGQEVNPVPEAAPDIAYEKFELDNGLTVIVHEDHKAPIVAVNIWYHVGSKNEPEGRSGFAHLFEHLMFNGSENYNDDYFQVMERVGATTLNGTTWVDRTNYFQNVPTSALDVALFMESDRMGHLLGAIDQEKLDEQRGVVQNEKRQGENQPYGQVGTLITEAIYPDDHPYGHTTIGSMEDLNAASLEDVQDWFKTYYGPNNAVLVLAGDIDVETAREKAEQFFGDIPPGPPIAQYDTWIPDLGGERRQVMQDRVPQSRIYKVWHAPEWGNEDATYLDLVADILSSGKTSRLYHRLVYEDQIATDVAAYIMPMEIAGQFRIQATARPDGDLEAVEAAIDEELARLLSEGPTEQELQRVQTQYRAGFVRSLEEVGGFGGKSEILAENEVYGDDPGFFRTELQRVNEATTDDLQRVAQRWLTGDVYALEVHPFPEHTAAAEGVDRSDLPEAGTPPVAEFPELQRTTLSNGLEIVLAERHAAPLVDVRLIVDAGYAADQFAEPGTASLAMNMLDEGTESRSALEISEELAMLGASLGTGSDLDISIVQLSALRENLDPTLALFTDVILNPSFPEGELDRLKAERLAQIQREKVTPIQMALRVFPELLYGEGHAYGLPLTGSGTEESVRTIDRSDLEQFHDTWFKPNHSTLVVVGDITMDELKPRVERAFSEWKSGETPTKNVAQVEHKDAPSIYILDRPGSQQSIIFAGHLAPPKNNPQEIAIETMNNILGGAFTSRINMNLREDKGWAYGAFSLLWDARGQRPFIVYAPVQSDKTKESMAEIQSELTGFLGDEPPTDDELDKAVRNQTLQLPGRWETINSVESSVSEIVQFGLGDDYYQTYAERVKNLSLDAIQGAAEDVIHPDRLVWVVVGDRSQIEPGLRELGFGEIRIVNSDGEVVDAGAGRENAGG